MTMSPEQESEALRQEIHALSESKGSLIRELSATRTNYDRRVDELISDLEQAKRDRDEALELKERAERGHKDMLRQRNEAVAKGHEYSQTVSRLQQLLGEAENQRDRAVADREGKVDSALHEAAQAREKADGIPKLMERIVFLETERDQALNANAELRHQVNDLRDRRDDSATADDLAQELRAHQADAALLVNAPDHPVSHHHSIGLSCPRCPWPDRAYYWLADFAGEVPGD